METPSFLQWVPLLSWYVIGGIPAFIVIRRAGMSGWWGLFLVIPIVGFVIVLWILAFARWPVFRRVDGVQADQRLEELDCLVAEAQRRRPRMRR